MEGHSLRNNGDKYPRIRERWTPQINSILTIPDMKENVCPDTV
jgi:hypothetical protein